MVTAVKISIAASCRSLLDSMRSMFWQDYSRQLGMSLELGSVVTSKLTDDLKSAARSFIPTNCCILSSIDKMQSCRI